MQSGGLPGYLSFKAVRGVNLNYSKYSKALPSVTKLLSDSDGEPIIWKIIDSQSFDEKGNPFLFSVGFFAGDNGKHDFPGNRGCRSIKVGAFSFIMPSNSARMQPAAQISIPGPQSFSSRMISGALYQRVTTWPVNSRFMFLLASLVLTSLARMTSFCSALTSSSLDALKRPTSGFQTSFLDPIVILALNFSASYWLSLPLPLPSSCSSNVKALPAFFSTLPISFLISTLDKIIAALSRPASERASPKSHNLTVQSSLIKTFAGLRSLWRTLDS